MILDLKVAILSGAIFGVLHGAAQAAPVTPNFTTGTMTSHTQSTTTVRETIHQIDYHVGWNYTVTGTNINVPGTPQLGHAYTIQNQGEAFQFSENYFGPGKSRETYIDRTTVLTSTTDTTSIFSQ